MDPQTNHTMIEQTIQMTQNGNYSPQISDNNSNIAPGGISHSTPRHDQPIKTTIMKPPMQLSQPMYTELQSVITKKQNLKKKLHQNQHFENNRFLLHSQNDSHQKQFIQPISPMKHPTPVGISKLPDIAYEYHNYIQGNGQTSASQQYNGKKQERLWMENEMSNASIKLSKELSNHADDSCAYYNQSRSNKSQKSCENDMTKCSESEMKTETCSTSVGRAVAQLHLSYDDITNNTYNNSLSKVNYQIRNSVSEFTTKNEKCEMFLEGLQKEKFHSNFAGEKPDMSKSETNLDICASTKKLSLDGRLGFKETINTLSENGKNTCKTNVSEMHAGSSAKQTNNVIKYYGQYDQKSFFVTDSSKFTKEVDQTDFENRKILANQSETLETSSDYDKTERCSSNIDSGRGSDVFTNDKKCSAEEFDCLKGQEAEWIDIVESELNTILGPNNISIINHSNLSESDSSVTPPLPPVTPPNNSRIPVDRYNTSSDHVDKSYYNDYVRKLGTSNSQNGFKKRDISEYKTQVLNNYNDRIIGGDLTSTTTGLDLDSMLDRSDSDLSINDARTIKKQLDGLEHMYTEVLKLLGNNSKQKRKKRGLASYGSVSSLPTSSVSSRPLARHYDKKKSYSIDDRLKKTKDIKNINKRFQRLESHVVTLARSVAHLSSEMRTQHLMMQEMENIRGEISTLRTQTNMAMIRSQSQPVIKDSDLPALSNPTRVKKLTKFFGVEPPLIRLFLRELGYEKYANLFEKEKIGMVELPYLSEERLDEMGVPLGPRLRILQEARISVCKNPVYVI